MKHLKKFAAVSQLNNWIQNNLSSYEEPNIYTVGDNKDNLEVQYNKDYTIITLDTSIQNSVASNSEGLLWTTYNGDIFEEILLDGVKIDDHLTPVTYNDIPKGKHILKMKFKNNIIGSSAPVFYNSFVKKVKIAKNIINIGANAFNSCYELDEIDFGNVTTIGAAVFASCNKLTEIEIPDSVTNIANTAFSGLPLRRVKVGKGITLITPQCYGAMNYLEEFIMSDSVTRIINNAFSGCTSLKSIVIPNGVTTIESQTFFNCTSLESIIIPDSVTMISNGAFEGCTALTSIDLSDSIHTISGGAFSGCTGLKEFTIPKNATNVANGILYNSGVKKLTIKSNTNIYVNSMRETSDAIEELIFDNNVTTIGSGCCYQCTGLKKVILPNTVEEITNTAFQACISLTSITIPSSTIKITNGAFQNCTSLESVNILGNTEISNGAFAGCTSLSSITFNSAVNLSTSAFSTCTALTSISIPENSVLSTGAFYNCTALTSISIPESVTSVFNDSIFTGCSSLGYVENGIRYVDVNTSIGTEIICIDDTTLSSYTIKYGVKNISFKIPELPNATEFNIPNTVTNFPGALDNIVSIFTLEQINALLAIDNNCISKSKKIEVFSYIENGIKYYDDPDTGTEIIDFVDTSLTSYSIKSGVKSITKSIPVLPNAEEFIIPSTVTSYASNVLNNIVDVFNDQELEDFFDTNAISKDLILNKKILSKSYLSQKYFSIYNASDNTQYIYYKPQGTASDNYYHLYYSKNNGKTWQGTGGFTSGVRSSRYSSISVFPHETIYFKGTPIPNSSSESIYSSSYIPISDYFVSDGSSPSISPQIGGIGMLSLDSPLLIPYGNIMSLLNGDNFENTNLVYNYSFTGLFQCSKIKNAANIILPPNIVRNCYSLMFFGCKDLTDIPELPATTLAEYCYKSMFEMCTSLTTVPELPATTLETSCYYAMFSGCTSLATAPELPATTLTNQCYYCMFRGCTSLVEAPELPATTLADYCYQYMFQGCTSLVEAPELPATTLEGYCYNNMFDGCTSLNYIKMLATNISASYCLYNWVNNVNSTGTFVKHVDATWSNSNVVPSGWTVEYYEPRPTPRELPEGYTEVKYIASTKTGGQYIDLNIKLYETLNTNYDIAIKFNIIGQGLNNTTNAAVFACQDPTGSPWPGTFIRKTGTSNSITGRYIGGTAKDNTIGQVNTIIELPVQTPPNKNVTNLSNSGLTHSYGTSLFCVFGDTNNTAKEFTEAKLYYFKLFVEGTLVRDLVPCINSSNVAGLYDVVNDVFYTSPNGAAFTYEAWTS